MTDTPMTGIDEYGSIIIDAYSGEAMSPDFAIMWRQFMNARNELEDVLDVIESDSRIATSTCIIEVIAYDHPFIWRDLTPEEREWSDQQYTERYPFDT